jgi:hypothetical protein
MAIQTQPSSRERCAADLEAALSDWIRASRRAMTAPPAGPEGRAEETAWAGVLEALGRAPLTRTGSRAG